LTKKYYIKEQLLKGGIAVLGQRGKTWLRTSFWLLILVTAFWPAAGIAASPALFTPRTWSPSFLVVSAQTPLEAQILGERPINSPALAGPSYLQDVCPGPEAAGDATLRLPKNFRISFRYNSENSGSGAERFSQPPLLFKYSMDYCLSSKLKVGLSGFLYQTPADHILFLRQKNDLIMGWGPSLKYDLGRWNFTFQSQVSQAEKASPDSNKDLQSWFRVWYAF
jgi:hypothetical protein